MSGIKEEVLEVSEIDPLLIKKEKIKNIGGTAVEKTTESALAEQLFSFLSCMRRDLGHSSPEKKDAISHMHQNLPVLCRIKPTIAENSLNGSKSCSEPPIKDHTCRFCQQIFPTKKQCQYHEKNVHPKKNVLCDICGQTTNIRRYNTHMKRHLNTRNFECPICSKRFKTQYDLKRHVNDIHENSSDFICDICDKGLRSKKSLRKHMIQFHMAQMALRCPECDRPFGDKSRLTRHLKVHKRARGEYIEVIKKEECHICHKMFANSTYLKQHMGKHNKGVKEFKCKICPSAFNFHSSLRNHERKVHEGKGRSVKRKTVKENAKDVEKLEETVLKIIETPQIFDGPITIVTNDSQLLYQLPFQFQ